MAYLPEKKTNIVTNKMPLFSNYLFQNYAFGSLIINNKTQTRVKPHYYFSSLKVPTFLKL